MTSKPNLVPILSNNLFKGKKFKDLTPEQKTHVDDLYTKLGQADPTNGRHIKNIIKWHGNKDPESGESTLNVEHGDH
ncbi:MAG TPA: hypothetical protein VMX17_00260, partial [Candidatus Glassbacteria bacterium]|nr:hypothetical protein [Candidatus Glassbacteria bacterium]